jgi:hypothetical protein
VTVFATVSAPVNRSCFGESVGSKEWPHLIDLSRCTIHQRLAAADDRFGDAAMSWLPELNGRKKT